MPHTLAFLPSAKREWDKLDGDIRGQFKKLLAARLLTPRIESAKLSGAPDLYKIKLRAAGYRLAYRVSDEMVTVTVVAVGRRDSDVYRVMLER